MTETKTVPVEPTREMIEAAQEAFPRSAPFVFPKIWSAMLSAAPSPLVGREEGHGFYVASRASVPERPAAWRRFREDGWPIVSTWIDEAGEGETADNGELWQRIDREIASCAALILYVAADDFPLKGAYIEVGMALARGKPVAVVLDGVELQPRSLRPLGSWAAHPLVKFYPNVLAALTDMSSEPSRLA